MQARAKDDREIGSERGRDSKSVCKRESESESERERSE